MSLSSWLVRAPAINCDHPTRLSATIIDGCCLSRSVFDGIDFGMRAASRARTLHLAGEDASSKPTKLLGGNQSELFQRGVCDEFRLHLPHLGSLKEATVVSDDFGASPAWHLEQVEVVDVHTGETSYFASSSWLSREAGLSVTLKVPQPGEFHPLGMFLTIPVSTHKRY